MSKGLKGLLSVQHVCNGLRRLKSGENSENTNFLLFMMHFVINSIIHYKKSSDLRKRAVGIGIKTGELKSFRLFAKRIDHSSNLLKNSLGGNWCFKGLSNITANAVNIKPSFLRNKNSVAHAFISSSDNLQASSAVVKRPLAKSSNPSLISEIKRASEETSREPSASAERRIRNSETASFKVCLRNLRARNNFSCISEGINSSRLIVVITFFLCQTKLTIIRFLNAFAYRVNELWEGIIPRFRLLSSLATADCVVPIRSATSCCVSSASSRAFKTFLKLTASVPEVLYARRSSELSECPTGVRSKRLSLAI